MRRCGVCDARVFADRLQRAVQVVGVSRSTIYYWMERGWIHWREVPSGRRVICEASLSRDARKGSAEAMATAPKPTGGLPAKGVAMLEGVGIGLALAVGIVVWRVVRASITSQPFGTPGSTNVLHVVRILGDELKGR